MGRLVSSASMSLDGYIVREDNTIREVVEWLQNGDAELLTVGDRITFDTSLSALPELVPVVMSRGGFDFGELSGDVVLGDPIQCVVGDRVTHFVSPTRMSPHEVVEVCR